MFAGMEEEQRLSWLIIPYFSSFVKEEVIL